MGSVHTQAYVLDTTPPTAIFTNDVIPQILLDGIGEYNDSYGPRITILNDGSFVIISWT